MNLDLTKLDLCLLVLLILLVGAYFGASYADNNWRYEMHNFSESSVKFRFDDSGIYYTIHSATAESEIDFKNITFISNP